MSAFENAKHFIGIVEYSVSGSTRIGVGGVCQAAFSRTYWLLKGQCHEIFDLYIFS